MQICGAFTKSTLEDSISVCISHVTSSSGYVSANKQTLEKFNKIL